MKYVVVLPFVHRPYMEECRATMAPEFLDNVLFVDNTVNNLGIMKSHNLGVDKVIKEDADWLIILSAAVRFGNPGGLDFIQHFIDFPEYNVIEAADVFGQHLIALSAQTLKRVGRYDENFGPFYGFEDVDYSLRIQKTYNYDAREGATKILWDKFSVDASDKKVGMAHSIKLGIIDDPAAPKIEYFKRKHGRHPGDSQLDSYDHPFNDPTKSWDWWPIPPDPRVNQEAGWNA